MEQPLFHVFQLGDESLGHNDLVVDRIEDPRDDRLLPHRRKSKRDALEDRL